MGDLSLSLALFIFLSFSAFDFLCLFYLEIGMQSLATPNKMTKMFSVFKQVFEHSPYWSDKQTVTSPKITQLVEPFLLFCSSWVIKPVLLFLTITIKS